MQGWGCLDRQIHINFLELKAVVAALHHWVSVLWGQVLIAMGNTTVVSYINKQGGTHSLTFLHLVVVLFMWLQVQDIVLSARLIPGCLNVITDGLSSPISQYRQSGVSFLLSRIEFSSFGELQWWTCLPQSQHLPTSVHVSDSGASSSGGRCSVSRLAGEIDVHVSTVPSAQQSHSETAGHPGSRSDTKS